jgi:2-oxoacid:acceptor oxidoreductase delta subunit (pyruvate/2-ketoisovalerate family)
MSVNEIFKTRKEMPVTTLSRPKVGVGITGFWRTFRPVVDYSKCTECALCWIFCPDGVIVRDESNSPKVDYEYCKGCGICANECPVNAIAMQREDQHK